MRSPHPGLAFVAWDLLGGKFIHSYSAQRSFKTKDSN
jgi:hypothetical protein